MDRRARAAFALLELVAVILILGLVMGAVAMNVMDRLQWARVETTKLKMTRLEGSLELFRLENHGFPDTEPGLDILLEEQPSGLRFVTKPEVLEDGWKRRFRYSSPGRHDQRTYDLWSWGRDGAAGGEGFDADIVNWSDGE